MKFTGWVVLILAIVLFLSGCGTGEDAPAQGAREWIDGVTNLDGNKILKYTCLAQRDNVKQASMWASAFSVLGQMFTNPNLKIEGDTSDLKFETVSREGNRAEVRVYGELRVAFSGVAEAHQIDERWQMVYENETWRWCSPITSVPPIAQTTSSSNQQSNTSPPSSTFTVYANQDWQDTGYSVGPEFVMEIQYISGMWSPWAGGSYDGQGFPGGDPYANNIVPGIHASLIARIGDNPPFFVGNSFAATTIPSPSPYPGNLYLRINDTTLNDNSGSIDVGIRVAPKEK
jgi:hypothetical protein